MVYRLVKNIRSDSVNGFKVGHILYLHHIKEFEAKEIRKTPYR